MPGIRSLLVWRIQSCPGLGAEPLPLAPLLPGLVGRRLQARSLPRGRVGGASPLMETAALGPGPVEVKDSGWRQGVLW